jgi:hypothetical protein
LAHVFRSVSSSWQGGDGKAEKFIFWGPVSREQQQEVARVRLLAKDTPPVTYFLGKGMKFHHLPIIYSNFESTKGSNHSLGKSS